MIEIYENDKIVFVAPLSRQDEFYVEETQEAELTSSTLEESDNPGRAIKTSIKMDYGCLSLMNFIM